MSTPLGQMPKPSAERFKKGKKLYLVPLFLVSPESPPDLQRLVNRYWSEAQDHIRRLEDSLGSVSHIYHETVYLSDEDGRKQIEEINPKAYPMIDSRCQAGAKLEATEERALMEESADWQRCLTVGLMSQKASMTVLQAYLEVTGKRYEHIAARISETLKESESAILVIGDNHRVQFPGDIEVFYISPPALNDLQRWLDDRMREQVPQEGEQAPPDAEESAPEAGESVPDCQEEQPQ